MKTEHEPPCDKDSNRELVLELSLFLASDEMQEFHKTYIGTCVQDAIAIIRRLRGR